MSKKGRKLSEEHKKKIGAANAISHKGLKQAPGHIAKRTAYLIGNKWNVGKTQSPESVAKRALANTGKKRTEETKRKTSESHKGLKKPWSKFPVRRGEANHNWKGGITPINKKIRASLEYKLWRLAVFERDDFTCVWCKRRGGVLNADHIKPFAYYPELRFAIDNGRTLCLSCHRTTETYGRRCKFLALK